MTDEERLKRKEEIQEGRLKRRARRAALRVGWQGARERKVFAYTESTLLLERSLRTSLLEGHDRETARLRELLKARRRLKNMNRLYHEIAFVAKHDPLSLLALNSFIGYEIPSIKKLVEKFKGDWQCNSQAAIDKRKLRKASRKIDQFNLSKLHDKSTLS